MNTHRALLDQFSTVDDPDVFDGLVLRVYWDLGDLLDDFHAFDYFSKDAVVSRSGRVGNEEMVRSCSTVVFGG